VKAEGIHGRRFLLPKIQFSPLRKAPISSEESGAIATSSRKVAQLGTFSK
jgi:hypothetical protein